SAGGKTAAETAGGKHVCLSPVIAKPGAGCSDGEVRHVREDCQQGQQRLRRWLPDKFQIRQPTLGWMLLARQFCLVDNMQKRSRLQNVRGVQGGRDVRGLETS